MDEDNNNQLPAADTGNASNPSPHNNNLDTVNDRSLLGSKAEKYLRESANIEDEPDAQDEQEADDTMERESK